MYLSNKYEENYSANVIYASIQKEKIRYISNRAIIYTHKHVFIVKKIVIELIKIQCNGDRMQVLWLCTYEVKNCRKTCFSWF